MGFVDITEFFPVDPPVGAGTQHATEDSALTGEDLPCESYMYDFCRSIENIDFAALSGARGTRAASALPAIRGRVAWRASAVCCADEWRLARQFAATGQHVQHTLPGPMTIISRTSNEHYAEERELAEDLAAIINAQVRALVSAGCRSIHIEEPALVQEFERARAWGIEVVGRCVEGVAEGCEISIHLGCGYHTSDGQRLQSYLHELARMVRDANNPDGPSSLPIQL